MNNLPLYNNSNSLGMDRNTSNFGLWYNKFPSFWNNDWEFDKDSKQKWVDQFKSGLLQGNIGNKEYISEIVNRQNQLVTSLGGRILKFSTLSRLLVGLGNYHPLEQGLTFHPVLGLPYVPASSLKGMLRWYLKQFLAIDSDNLSRMLGSKEGMGSIILFDLIPADQIQLEPETMTPHYDEYYQSKGKQVPGDWYDPKPIPLVGISTDKKFQMGVVAEANDMATITKAIKQSLRDIGVGAKTTVGYGRFRSI